MSRNGHGPGNGELDSDGDSVLQELRRALDEADRVPEDVLGAARASFWWRSVDSELAELTYDSLLDDERLASVRGASDGPRALTFERGDVVVDVEVAASAGGHQLLGQVVAPAVESVVLERPDAAARDEIAVDDLGRFRVASLGPGPVRLRCRLGGEDAAVVTDWVVI